jgi:hypothetical protein
MHGSGCSIAAGFFDPKKYEKNVNASETTTICALKMTGNYGCGRLIQIILLSNIWLE